MPTYLNYSYKKFYIAPLLIYQLSLWNILLFIQTLKSNKYFTNLKKALTWKNIQEEENKEVLDLFQDYCLLQIPEDMHIPQQTKIILITEEHNNFEINGDFTYYKKSIAKFIVHQQDLQKYHLLLNSIRKSQHIDICRSYDVESKDKYTGFAKIQFKHSALPEIDIDKIDYKTTVLGEKHSHTQFS